MLPISGIEGRLGADPDLRFSPSGTAVASLRIVAADRRRKADGSGWEDSDTLWFDAACFGTVAENVAESLQRGDDVVMLGKWHTEEWEDREGQKKSKISFICNAIGPSLRFRSTPHGAGKAERSSSSSSGNDPWSSDSGAGTPAANTTDEPPF